MKIVWVFGTFYKLLDDEKISENELVKLKN